MTFEELLMKSNTLTISNDTSVLNPALGATLPFPKTVLYMLSSY